MIPKNFNLPTNKSSQFLNPHKLPQGQTVVRILSDKLIEGFVFFDKNNRPHRRQITRNESGDINKECFFTDDECFLHECRKNDKGAFDIKYFWLFAVYHWDSQSFKAMEITQKSLIKGLMGIFQTEHPKQKGVFPYANPIEYDVVFTRQNEGLNTEYSVMRLDKEPLDQAILDTFQSLNCDLEAVFRNEYPFS
jgi:hypothetical protein